MRRIEAVVLLAIAMVLITAAVTWLFGAYGLGAAGVVLLVTTLFAVDIRKE